MAIAWIYSTEKRPTTNSNFNQTSNLITTNLGGGYFSRYNNGTANYNIEISYEYDYLTITELNSLEEYLATVSSGETIDLPDYSVDYSAATTVKAFVTGYTKGLSQGSSVHWTVNITFRRVYE